MTKTRKWLWGAAITLVAIGSLGFGAVRYYNDPDRDVPTVFSGNTMLYELWQDYKANTIEPSSFRTYDRSQNNITTSEGQSYTMLRSVWMDDKTTFDKSWEFTKNNLQRPDKLFSWKYGERGDKSYGILTDIGGQNTASDADIDIAMSLMMAYTRWNETSYLYQAKEIVNAVWNQEVVVIQGKPVLVANDLEKNSTTTVVVNPSYFAPANFKLFAKLDPRHDWNGLADNSYSLLAQLAAAPLDKSRTSGLPPNWILINRQSGAFVPSNSGDLNTAYGYDALRIPFRLALDYAWFKDPRDKQLLTSFSFLGDQWRSQGKLATVYAHDGTVIGDYESPAMYGGALGYFKVADQSVGRDYYEQKLATLYSPDKQKWQQTLSYYDDNWAWFGIALYQNALPNLAEMNN